MKKLLCIVTLFFSVIGIEVRAEKSDGFTTKVTYHSDYHKKDFEIILHSGSYTIGKGKFKNLHIDVQFETEKGNKAYVQLRNIDVIEEFRDILIECGEKYDKWRRLEASKNTVKELGIFVNPSKGIIAQKYVLWEEYGGWYSSLGDETKIGPMGMTKKDLGFTFVFNSQNGEPLMCCNKEYNTKSTKVNSITQGVNAFGNATGQRVVTTSDEWHSVQFLHFFNSIEDIKVLYDALDPAVLLEILKKQAEQWDSLR